MYDDDFLQVLQDDLDETFGKRIHLPIVRFKNLVFIGPQKFYKSEHVEVAETSRPEQNKGKITLMKSASVEDKAKAHDRPVL